MPRFRCMSNRPRANLQPESGFFRRTQVKRSAPGDKLQGLENATSSTGD